MDIDVRITGLTILSIGAIVFLYYAISSTPDDSAHVPQYQNEAQMMGLGIVDTLATLNPETMLDMRPSCHFWEPRQDPDPASTTTVKTAHRYPVVPGGNLSTVMHKGWSQFCKSSPDSDWFYNPPEAAVL